MKKTLLLLFMVAIVASSIFTPQVAHADTIYRDVHWTRLPSYLSPNQDVYLDRFSSSSGYRLYRISAYDYREGDEINGSTSRDGFTWYTEQCAKVYGNIKVWAENSNGDIVWQDSRNVDYRGSGSCRRSNVNSFSFGGNFNATGAGSLRIYARHTLRNGRTDSDEGYVKGEYADVRFDTNPDYGETWGFRVYMIDEVTGELLQTAVDAEAAKNAALDAKNAANNARSAANNVNTIANNTLTVGAGVIQDASGTVLDEARLAKTKANLSASRALNAYNKASQTLTAVNNTNDNLSNRLDDVENIINNVDTTINNISENLPPTLFEVGGYQNATATQTSSFRVSLDYANAKEFRYRLEGGSWSIWASLSSHDTSGYFTVTGISAGMHTIQVELRNSVGGVEAKGKMTFFRL